MGIVKWPITLVHFSYSFFALKAVLVFSGWRFLFVGSGVSTDPVCYSHAKVLGASWLFKVREEERGAPHLSNGFSKL